MLILAGTPDLCRHVLCTQHSCRDARPHLLSSSFVSSSHPLFLASEMTRSQAKQSSAGFSLKLHFSITKYLHNRIVSSIWSLRYYDQRAPWWSSGLVLLFLMNAEQKMNNVCCRLESTTVSDGGGTDARPCEKLRKKTRLEHIESVHKSPHPHPHPQPQRAWTRCRRSHDDIVTSAKQVGAYDHPRKSDGSMRPFLLRLFDCHEPRSSITTNMSNTGSGGILPPLTDPQRFWRLTSI